MGEIQAQVTDEGEMPALSISPPSNDPAKTGLVTVLKMDYDELRHMHEECDTRYRAEIEDLKCKIELLKQQLTDQQKFGEGLIQDLKDCEDTAEELTRNFVNKTPIERVFDTIPGVAAPLPDGVQLTDAQIQTCGTLLGVPDFDSFCRVLPDDMTKTSKHGNALFSNRLQLAIFLFWLRRGFPYDVIAALCCCSDSAISKWLDGILEDLLPWANQQISLPDVPEWLESLSPEFVTDYPNVLMLFTDGTPIEIFSPSNVGLKQNMWNPKHGMPAFCFSAMCDLKGFVRWFSDITPGKTNDATAWNESLVAEKLHAKYSHLFRVYPHLKFAICGDKAYPCIELPDGMTIYVTKSAEETITIEEGAAPISRQSSSTTPKVSKHPQVNRSTYANRVLCSKVAQYRSIIERTFKRIKCWQLLKSRHQMSGDPIRLQKLIKCIVGLENWCLKWRSDNKQEV